MSNVRRVALSGLIISLKKFKQVIRLSLPVGFTRQTKVVIKYSDLSHKIFAPNKGIRLTSIRLGKVRWVAFKHALNTKLTPAHTPHTSRQMPDGQNTLECRKPLYIRLYESSRFRVQCCRL